MFLPFDVQAFVRLAAPWNRRHIDGATQGCSLSQRSLQPAACGGGILGGGIDGMGRRRSRCTWLLAYRQPSGTPRWLYAPARTLRCTFADSSGRASDSLLEGGPN